MFNNKRRLLFAAVALLGSLASAQINNPGPPLTITEKTKTASYTSLAADFSTATTPPTEVIFTISSTTAVIWNPPASAPALVSGNMPCVIVDNSAASMPFELVVESNGLTLDGTNYSAANSVAIDPGKGVTICSDGSNYRVSGGHLTILNSTVGQDGFWIGGTPDVAIGVQQGSLLAPTNNTMFFVQTMLTRTEVIGHATIDVTTAGTAETFYVCFYNAAGTTLLWSASGTVNSIAITTFSASQYFAPPGVYLAAFEQTGTTGAVMGIVNNSGPLNSIANKNGNRMGTTANTVSGSACPATLGTLTPTIPGAIAAIAFEP